MWPNSHLGFVLQLTWSIRGWNNAKGKAEEKRYIPASSGYVAKSFWKPEIVSDILMYSSIWNKLFISSVRRWEVSFWKTWYASLENNWRVGREGLLLNRKMLGFPVLEQIFENILQIRWCRKGINDELQYTNTSMNVLNFSLWIYTVRTTNFQIFWNCFFCSVDDSYSCVCILFWFFFYPFCR